MKAIRKNKLWFWAIAVLLLASLGILVWFLIPGLRPTYLDYGPTGEPAAVAEYWPADGWRAGTPEEQGFDSAKLAEALQNLHKNHIAIDSLLIIRNGYVILDAGFYPYDGTSMHDLASVTKSITTTLVAIAAGQGKINLDQPMVSYFPDRTIANLDDWKQTITVRNLAGMVNGMKSGCANNDEATLDAMRSQSDWVQAALGRKMSNAPGKVFCYDSPGMHILSAILQETTGKTELEFARENLFEPLGITDFYWESDPQGYTHGWGDLHLAPRDAAKIGYLYLHHGVWEGKQIVPADWTVDAVQVQIKTGRADDYGYGWWVSSNSYFALGRGGQHIKVYPALDIIVVTTGAGFEYATLDPLLEAAFVDPENPLLPNPEGMSQLKAVLAEIIQGPAMQPATSLPEIANDISGKTYRCDSNEAGISSFRFEFNDLEVLKMDMEQNGQAVTWDIGLDGKYRMAPVGPTRGYWEDPQTFVIQIFDIGTVTRTLSFSGNVLDVRIPEVNITLKCQVQNP